MYFRKKASGGRFYPQIAVSRRAAAVVRQQVIATLGRFDDLQWSGHLERLLRSGVRFADKAILVEAVASGDVATSAADRTGAGVRSALGGHRLSCRRRKPRPCA